MASLREWSLCSSCATSENFPIVRPSGKIDPFGVKFQEKFKQARDNMHVLHFPTLKVMGRIPRSCEKVTVLYKSIPRASMFLVMVSHRWLLPNGSSRWPRGDPDDSVCSKYVLLVAALGKVVGMLRDGLTEDNIFIWIDFSCIDQDQANSSIDHMDSMKYSHIPLDMLALDYYIQQSDAVLTPVVDEDVSWKDNWSVSGKDKNIFNAYGAKAWATYWSRGWCRLEAFFAAALPCRDLGGQEPVFRAMALYGRRPHLLYGTLEYESASHGKIWTLPALSGEFFEQYHPCLGEITKREDRDLIDCFVTKLHGYVETLNNSSYEGEVDATGEPHGKGRQVLADYTVYEGGFNHGKRHGYGEASYANGVRFEGHYEQDMRSGMGTEWWPNGKLKHRGMYERGERHGEGEMYSEDGVLLHKGVFPEQRVRTLSSDSSEKSKQRPHKEFSDNSISHSPSFKSDAFIERRYGSVQQGSFLTATNLATSDNLDKFRVWL